ncbi:tartrate dehydrogenase [candidate division KSB1 bacterium]|nr:tartrate dehydrogenase [candidate division KSB1 bacterium]
MKIYNIAVVPGDGIGHEIVPAGLKIIKAVGTKANFEIKSEEFPYGSGYYKRAGIFMPDDALENLQKFDAIYFGGIGLPDVDDTLPAKEFTFKVRNNFRQYVNFRPVRTFPGVTRPIRSEKEIDFVVVRENNEGEFSQIGGQYMPHFPEGLGVDVSIFSRKGIERIAHYAFKLARIRRKYLVAVTKSNTLINSLTYWDRVISEVAAQYPDVDWRFMYVDNCSANFVLRPEQFDVVLTTNLFGDILSDLGGAIMGSLGLGGSGNINPEREYPSMFEPIHGSAPDIAGKNIANPIGTIWSGAMMLEHLGEFDAASRIMRAVDSVCSAGILPVDLGGDTKTDEFAEAVIGKL